MHLVEKLREAKCFSFMTVTNNDDLEEKEPEFSNKDPSDGTLSEEVMSPASTRAVQAGIPSTFPASVLKTFVSILFGNSPWSIVCCTLP